MTSFQASQGIPPTGSCDELTWSLLVESGWALGDRLLMLTAPNLRGEDVAELQRILARLGFDCGRVDGIYGPDTTAALQDLQRNSGLPMMESVVLTRSRTDVLSRNTGSGPGVVMVRGCCRASGRRSLGHLRIVIGEYGGLGALARQVTTALRQHSAPATVIGDPDASTHAALRIATEQMCTSDSKPRTSRYRSSSITPYLVLNLLRVARSVSNSLMMFGIR